MVKILSSIACLLILFNSSVFSTELECQYEISHQWYYYIGRVYQCILYQTPYIRSPEEATITAIKTHGEHKDDNTIKNVLGFTATYKWPMFYFPKGLEKQFGSLQVISIYNSGLQEIRQSDLKPFPDLTYFSTAFNDIQVVEQGLFDYNPNLSFVQFQERKLLHVDPNVFDRLEDLGYLWMEVAPCIEREVWNSRSKVLEMIKDVKSRCVSPNYAALEGEVTKLESESKNLDSAAFKTTLKAFDEKFGNSVLLKFSPLQSKYEALKASH